MIALTFDDGPSSLTPSVLDTLEQERVKATFFLIGQQVTDEMRPILERQLALGCEIANHTYTHPDMSEMTAEAITEEVEKCAEAIQKQVPVECKYFRPPYIALSNTLFDTVDLTFICGMGCQDWEPEVTADERMHLLRQGLRDNTIVLLHDMEGNVNTAKILPELIRYCREQGWELGTLTEFFEAAGVESKVKGKIWTTID